MSLKTTFTTILFFSILHTGFGQMKKLPFEREPGKCYAKCFIPHIYEEVEETFAVFIGGPNPEVELDSVFFDVDDHTGKSVYLGYENDLTNEQLESIDQWDKIVFVVDTTTTSDYIEESMVYLKIIEERGALEWREVVCGNKIGSILLDIQTTLFNKGYLETNERVQHFTEKIKTALRHYQKDNSLPIGNLNKETLDSLGVFI